MKKLFAQINFLLMLLCVLLFSQSAFSQSGTYFTDNFESGLGKWVYSGQDWDTTSATFRAGGHSITDSPYGNYPPNANFTIHTMNQINLTSAVRPILTFWNRSDISDYSWGWDFAYVDVSTDNGFNWTEIQRFEGTANSWHFEQIDLAPYSGQRIKIRFRLVDYGNVQADGWYIDDVSVQELPADNIVSLPFTDDFESGLAKWVYSGQDWDTTSASFRAGGHSLTDSPNGNYPYRANSILHTLNQIDLSSAVHPVITFWTHHNLPNDWGGYDLACVDVSTDNGFNWTEIRRFENSVYYWQFVQIELSQYVGQRIKIRFRLFEEGESQADGWYIDDVSVQELPQDNIVNLPYTEDFESGISNWVCSGLDWDTTSAMSRTGGHSITDSPNRSYPNLAYSIIHSFKRIDLTNAVHPILTFWSRQFIAVHFPNTNDYICVDISTDNGFNWAEIRSYEGTFNSWWFEQIDLSQYIGQRIKIRFRLVDCGRGEADGWYIDDISVQELPTDNIVNLPFTDDFESGLGKWVYSGQDWNTTTSSARAGAHSITDSPSGNYFNQAYSIIHSLNRIDLTNAVHPILTFWSRQFIAVHYPYTNDYVCVDISTDNGFNWAEIRRYEGTLNSWWFEQIDLSQYIGQRIKIRFRLVDCGRGEADGWYIDDISVQELPTNNIVNLPFTDDFESGLGKWVYSGQDWNTTTASARAGYHSITDSPSGNYPDCAYSIIHSINRIDLSNAVSPMLTFWTHYNLAADGAYGNDLAFVDVSTDNGFNWSTIRAFEYDATPWQFVQLDLTSFIGQCIKIRFRLTEQGRFEADGWYIDDVAITADKMLRVINPNGGEAWERGTERSISWVNSSVNNVKIEFTTNNGSTWTTIVENSPAYPSTFNWTVPNTISTQCKIKISDVSDPGVFDVSDSTFAIFQTPVVLNLPSIGAFAGDTVTVPIVLENFKLLSGIAASVLYDPSVISFLDTANVSPLIPGLNIIDSTGKISLAWNSTSAITDSSEKLVDLRFVFLGDTTALSCLRSETKFLDKNGDTIPYQTIGGIVQEILTSVLSGTLTYRNSAGTPLFGAVVHLAQAGVYLYSDSTNNTGEFLFPRVIPGAYNLITGHSALWAGVNSTDALIIRRYAVHLQTLDSLQLKAADVNMNTTVNSTDALFIRRRLIGMDTSFVRGDWVFEAPTVSLTDANVVQNILGLCTGDVNGSNTPGVLKATPTVNLLAKGILETLEGKDFNIPVYISTRSAIGAVTLMFEYPEESMDIKGITSKMNGMLFSAKDGILTIAWDDIAGATFTENEPLFTIIAADKKSESKERSFSLIAEYSEIADLEANVLSGVTVTMPEIGAALPSEFALSQNYPNPFNPSTTIQYDIPTNSHVRIEIFNTLGEVVEVLADAVQAPGRYTAVWNAKNSTSGVYFYRMTAESGTKNFTQVKKLMLIK